MYSEINKICKKMEGMISEIEMLEASKNNIMKRVEELHNKFRTNNINSTEYEKRLKDVLKGKSEQEWTNKFNSSIDKLLRDLMLNNRIIAKLFDVESDIIPVPVVETAGKIILDKAIEKKVFQEIGISKKNIKEFIERQKKKKEEITVETKYITYSYTLFGSISNKLFGELTKNLTKKYPAYFKDLYNSLRISNIKILSGTYISMGVFASFLTWFLVTIVCFLILLPDTLFGIIQCFVYGFLSTLTVVVAFYFYPQAVISSRKRAIKNDMPFAVIHMAAISGSGAPLVQVFSMLLKSGDYKGLDGELKKIMNYVNLFGYNLSNALRAVAKDTPSHEFKEVLNGIITCIETGGDLKQYLKSKADDTISNYRLERKKYVESLSTYSDIYTAILLAAPLLFIIILAVINMIGGQVAGLDVKDVAKIGTYVVLPGLNLMYLMFLNIIQPEM